MELKNPPGSMPLQSREQLQVFFAGLGAASKKNSLVVGLLEEFLEIMRSFDTREICDMYESLLEIYADEDQDDFFLIRKKLSEHAADLQEALQNFSLGSS